MNGEALLVAERMALTYPGLVPVEALRPTDLTIGRGDHVAITGPSGSGKSTLLNVLGLIDVPTAGRYLVGGVDTALLGEADRTALRARFFGFVFQAFHLVAGRTVVENVELGMLYTRLGRRERRRRVDEALERVELGHRAGAVPATLSGGERQRVAIARAVAGRPEVLLCDEPTGNLDSTTSTAVLDLIDELKATVGLTVIMVTHDPVVAARAGRLLSVHDGMVVELAPAAP